MTDEAESKLQYAGLGVRCVALLLDMLIATPIFGLLYFLIPDAMIRDAVFMGIVFVGYCVAFSSNWQGTPGMKVMEVKIVDAQGNRISWLRALVWCLVSMGLVAVTMAGMFYIQMHYDIEAIQKLMWQMTISGRPTQAQLYELEQLMGMPIAEFNAMMAQISLLTLVLCLVWFISALRGSQKAGFHNWITGTRLIVTKDSSQS